MTRTLLIQLLTAVILIAAQVVVFNHVCIFDVAVPFVFLYILLALPLTISVNWVLTIGFFTGLIVDVFSDTHGLYALACTITSGLRQPVLRLYFPREEDLTDPRPRADTLGPGAYARYVVTLTLVFCTVVFLGDAMSFRQPLHLLLSIVTSTILTSAIIISLDYLTASRRYEKRL